VHDAPSPTEVDVEPSVVPWSPIAIPDQRGRVAVVTGATSGLGTATVHELARARAHVVLTARDPKKGEATLARIRNDVPGAQVDVGQLDLTSLASVGRFADEVAARHDRVDILVNNAGVMATPKARTEDGFELQIGTNHLGPLALTARLLHLVEAAPEGRIVTVASHAHQFGAIDLNDLSWERRRYVRWLAYGQSKLANLLFTFELERRLVAAGSPAKALAAHPGFARTPLGRSWRGPLAALQSVGMLLSTPFTQPAARGAHPQLRAATDPDLPGGAYLGPGGRGEARGPAMVVGCSPAARDMAMAGALWDLSVRLTGADFGRL
jgi:NAD(P)-dependent dehydrogenase (short-subunit alcohol dehydrogenase family)